MKTTQAHHMDDTTIMNPTGSGKSRTFEELSRIYLDYLQDRADFIRDIPDRDGITLLYKDTQTSGTEEYTRPVVLIRTKEACDWYNKKVALFRKTIRLLVQEDPYTYSPKSPRLKEPEEVITLAIKSALHEQTAISSRTETVSAMRARIKRTLKKAQRDFKITFSKDAKDHMMDAESDMALLERFKGDEILRRRMPSSSDVSANVWYSRNAKPERHRVTYTGLAFYVPTDKDAVYINGDTSLHWPAGSSKPEPVRHHEVIEVAKQAFFQVFAPNNSEALGGKERSNPMRDAFENNIINPFPFKTMGTTAVYLESEIESFRKNLDGTKPTS